MILGLGTDLVSVSRIGNSLQRHEEAFLRRVLTPAEQEFCMDFTKKSERIAGRWSAKEACMKALGRGMTQGVAFTDIEVLPNDFGAPVMTLSGGAKARASELGVARIHVSITHTADMAMATVILESE